MSIHSNKLSYLKKREGCKHEERNPSLIFEKLDTIFWIRLFGNLSKFIMIIENNFLIEQWKMIFPLHFDIIVVDSPFRIHE